MPEKSDKILVATSLERASDVVVRSARDLARTTNTSLTIAHAVPLPSSFYVAPMGMATIDPELLEHQRQKGKLEIEAQLLRLGGGPPDPEILVEVGAPHRLLLRTVEDGAFDLLVVGDRESRGPWAPVIGSTTDRVLRKASCPVLVVRDHFPMPPKRVLAPVDLSENSVPVLRQGLAQLDAWSGGQGIDVEALFVLDPLDRNALHFTEEQMDRFAAEELERQVQLAQEGFASKVHSAVRVGLPRQEILKHLDQRPFDLVMLSSHGRTGLDRLMLGSVALSICHRAPTCVLYLPSPREG